MRIHVISPMWPSETSKHTGVFVRNLSDSLTALGFDVDSSAVLRGKGIGRRGRIAKHAALGRDILRQALAPADCVYVHAPTWFSPLVDLSRRIGDKKLVVHTHGGEVYPHSRIEHDTKPIVGWLCRRADLVVAPSHYYEREVVRAFDVDASKTFVSPSGGVDTKRFSPRDKAAAREALGLKRDAIVLGFVGRVVEDKGWDVFLETVHRLAKGRRDVHGLVVGDGDDLPELRARADALGIGDRVRCLGMIAQTELPDAYASMDVFLFPTRRGAEALGLVPIEAMAMGVPVVGSNGYAVPEYVEDGSNGFLAPERDVDAFVAAVTKILERSESERRAMSERAVATAKRYDAEAITNALAERLRALIRGH